MRCKGRDNAALWLEDAHSIEDGLVRTLGLLVGELLEDGTEEGSRLLLVGNLDELEAVRSRTRKEEGIEGGTTKECGHEHSNTRAGLRRDEPAQRLG